jgi:outer membrane protein OmpA-like peptidoglycan-associated protein/uncharacterized protein YegL
VQCDVVKQMLFLVDVSGSMETNDRLNEAKQFALRIVKEHATKNLLYKLISYGGSCNEVITDVDWTRDATVINAGVKGLYLRGGTPLGSALEFTIDEIKKSAYPDQTKVILLNDGANACGEVSEILTRRMKEIPCVRFISIGIELEEEENGLSSRAVQDAQAIATQTGGSYVPLKDVREIRGVSLSDSAVVMRSVAFEPRPKPQAKAQEKPQTQASSSSPSSQTSSSTQSTTSASQTATQPASTTQTASTTQAEKPQSEKPQSEQSASPQPSSQQPSSTSQGASSSPQGSSAPLQNTSSQQGTSSQQSTTQSESVTQKDSSSPTQQKQSPSQAAPRSASESTAKAAPQQPSKTEERSGSRSANRRESAPPERVQESANSNPQTSTRELSPPPPTITDNNTEIAVIRFPISSAQLTWDARRSLERLAAEIRAELRVHLALVIDVGGHSSKEGTSEANLRLSVERAALVARYLRRMTGMREDRVRWTGYGELRPVIDDRFGRQENRRVEIRVYQSRQR